MIPNRNHSPIRNHSNLSRSRSCHYSMVGFRKQIHWDRCRLGQNRYHLVPMIRNQSPKACCHFAIRIGSRIANPIRIPIGYLIRFGSRFEIHCHLSRCRMAPNRRNRWIHLGHWNLNYLMSQS